MFWAILRRTLKIHKINVAILIKYTYSAREFHGPAIIGGLLFVGTCQGVIPSYLFMQADRIKINDYERNVVSGHVRR
jgi:hypothetical protein